MSGTTIGIQTGYGYAGQVSRQGYPLSRTRPVKSDVAGLISFGAPVIINDDGTVSPWAADSTAANFAGVAMRRVKSAATYPNQALAGYAASENADIVERGNVTVLCTYGTPKPGLPVYIRTVVDAAAPNSVVGSFEATAQADKNILLTNAKWATTKDTAGIAELAILSQYGV